MQYCNTAALQYSNTNMLQYCNNTVILRCNTTVLQYSNSELLQYYNSELLQYYNTKILKYCNSCNPALLWPHHLTGHRVLRVTAAIQLGAMENSAVYSGVHHGTVSLEERYLLNWKVRPKSDVLAYSMFSRPGRS